MKLSVALLVCAVACCGAAPQVFKQKTKPGDELKNQNAEGFKRIIFHTDDQEASADKSYREHAGNHKQKEDENDAAIFKKQAEGAHYEFESSVDDGIMDHAHYRSEKRDGLSVEGAYAYSDGFFRRTVHYVADDKGFRIVKEEEEPIGDGPVVDPKGKAVVKSSLGSEYTITVDDYQKRKEVD